MLLLYILIIWQAQIWTLPQFNMYNTNDGQDGYCLLYYTSDQFPRHIAYDGGFGIKTYKFPRQIIPFCLRSSPKRVSMMDFGIENTSDTFLVGFY